MRHLTREHALWIFIALSAGVLRFVALDLPLGDAEARVTLASLQAARGETAVLINPFAGLLQSIALALFGASSGVARCVSALAGCGLCLTPRLLRDVLGRERALALGLLLTCSPTLMFVSRQATGEMLAWTLAAVVAFSGQRSLLFASAAGLLLACGADAPFPIATALLARVLVGQKPIIPGNLRRTSLIVLGWSVVGATGILFRPAGLSDVFGGIAAWAQGFTATGGFSASRILLGFAVNELIVWVLGVIGLATALVKRDLSSLRLALGWLVCGLVALAAYAGRTPALAVPLTIGVALAASNALGRLIVSATNQPGWAQWAVAGAAFVMMQFVGIGLRQYAHQGQENFLLPIAVAILMCGAMILASRLNGELDAGLRGVGTALAVTLGVYALGTGVQLTQTRWNNPAEPYVLNAPSKQLETLADTLRMSAIRATGEPDGVPLIIDPAAPPSLRWALRDQSRLTLGSELGDLNAGVLPSAIKPATDRAFIGNGFEVARTSDLNLACGQDATSIICVPLAKWLIFRELGAEKITSQRWTLWLSEKLAAQTSGQR